MPTVPLQPCVAGSGERYPLYQNVREMGVLKDLTIRTLKSDEQSNAGGS